MQALPPDAPPHLAFSPAFYGLLFVSDGRGNSDSPNMQGLPSTSRRALPYLKMALRLAKGISREFNVRLHVITNESDTLITLLESLENNWSDFIDLAEHRFPLKFPSAARFSSASQKVSVIKLLSGRPGYSILLDLDILCIKTFPPELVEVMERGEPIVYDISDQTFPAYGYPIIRRDILRLLGTEFVSETRWYGGEFIGGNGEFFSQLSARIDEILPRYFEHWRSLHHQGDEMITTTAINLLRSQGYKVFDLAPLDLLRRFWGSRLLHPERPYELQSQNCFLHLPAKKGLLTSRLSDRAIRRIIRFNTLSRVLSRAFLMMR